MNTPDPGLATYQVTIENLTSGQPFSPPVAATHKEDSDDYCQCAERGQPPARTPEVKYIPH